MTGEPHSVKDRPRFDVDDTTTSYSPPRADRPRWVEQGWGSGASTAQATGSSGSTSSGGTSSSVGPQHWFDPSSTPPAGSSPPPPPPSARPPSSDGSRPSRGALVAGAAALAFVSAGLASGGTYGLLAMGGYLDSDR